MGERTSNLFGVLLSLTFFSVLLAVMLVAVSVLPDARVLTPPTLPGETSSGPVRTPQPATLGELALAPAPILEPAGAALASVTFTTTTVTGPTASQEPGGPAVGGPSRGPGFDRGGDIRSPSGLTPDASDGPSGPAKEKGGRGPAKRGHAFLRCEDDGGAGRGKGHKKGDAGGRGDGHCRHSAGNGPGGSVGGKGPGGPPSTQVSAAAKPSGSGGSGKAYGHGGGKGHPPGKSAGGNGHGKSNGAGKSNGGGGGGKGKGKH